MAAFKPMNDVSHQKFPRVATGNWGGAAFRGCVQLKAMVQWASASQVKRSLKYYPYDESFGPDLRKLCEEISSTGATVGQLVAVIEEMKHQGPLAPSDIFPFVRKRLVE